MKSLDNVVNRNVVNRFENKVLVKEVLDKIKQLETMVNLEEKMALYCYKSYSMYGSGSINFLFASSNADFVCEELHKVLTISDVSFKDLRIDNWRNSFCKCDEIAEKTGQDVFDMECHCELPSYEEGEEHYYEELIKSVIEKLPRRK